MLTKIKNEVLQEMPMAVLKDVFSKCLDIEIILEQYFSPNELYLSHENVFSQLVDLSFLCLAEIFRREKEQ